MRWKLKPLPELHEIQALQAAGIKSEILASLFLQRNIRDFDTAREFCNPDLSALHDPFLMRDMDVAVNRVLQALNQNERILVFGDYDVDGTTAVSLMYTYLATKTTSVSHYIPDRYTEGYGVSKRGIDFAADNDFTLIIALDCGIKSVELVAYAKTLGIDFIICDHHLPGAIIPEAVAVLDPKRVDCAYPYKELCGCGVGFKLVQAIESKLENDTDFVWSLLDFVAIAIAADIVPLTGENRILAYFGLELINRDCRVGLKALKQKSKKKVLDLEDLVFVFAPRINAAGRINLGRDAVELMIETDEQVAQSFADAIESYNETRREFDQQTTVEALEQIRKNKEEEAPATVVFDAHWNKGVIGIVASRLIETHYRPTLVFTKSKGVYAASGRSVAGFDLYQALEACQQHLVQFGGHTFAAGMTILPENYIEFKKAFNAVVQELRAPETLEPEIEIDMEIDIQRVSDNLVANYSRLGPFGPAHMKPVFLSKNVRIAASARTVGKDKSHLSFELELDDQRKITAIAFKQGSRVDEASGSVDVVYTINYNEFRDVRKLQLIVIDFRKSV
ncbi:single-stranded-DNA-specific exonuclease RecJ [Flavobacterium aurantiibacter]|uniref:Single-stranded-DNA-specific exonuclease RecJ n=1 Tax=Flavobacterium aurantiibacter TaxID=2023067 RepID=A0A255ZPH8_9FLAO|nr:single-stranded-DNA-specific exonuclease RecJ [Flavobacterium aurantiibacter]OYQ43321.1 single-stranded-DNA-specific exonuclease RecJ [Flavobacterium aurantiibacter]